MKKPLTLLFLLWTTSTAGFTQDTLYYENFETGGNTITLNTTDIGGTNNGSNYWIINNAYTGGTRRRTTGGISALTAAEDFCGVDWGRRNLTDKT